VIKIEHKHPVLADEWRRLLDFNPRLLMMALQWGDIFGDRLTITEIYRTQEMQTRYYPGKAVKSVHQYWRGIDISIRGFDLNIVKGKAATLCKLHPYDIKRPALKSFLVHDTGMGTHLHIQTADGGTS